MKVDMSTEAVTGRMNMLGQLWELAVALKSSEIVENEANDPESRREAIDPSHQNNRETNVETL